jgi:hypothetical protein
MKIFHAIAATMVVCALACLPALAQMPDTSNQADMQMTAKSRQQLIDSLIQEVNQS